MPYCYGPLVCDAFGPLGLYFLTMNDPPVDISSISKLCGAVSFGI